MVKKGILGAALALFALLTFSTVAGAQYGGPETVTVVQGESITVTGSGCEPGATVNFEITSGAYNTSAGSTTAGSDGTYTSQVTIPSGVPVGTATLTGTCGDNVQVLNLNINAAAAPVSNGTLPRTGSDNTQTLLGVGAGFLLLGGTLAVGARRTRRSTVAA